MTDENYVDVFLFCGGGFNLDWLHFCLGFGGWDLRTSAGPALGHRHVLVLRGGGGRLTRRLKVQNTSTVDDSFNGFFRRSSDVR